MFRGHAEAREQAVLRVRLHGGKLPGQVRVQGQLLLQGRQQAGGREMLLKGRQGGSGTQAGHDGRRRRPIQGSAPYETKACRD